MLTTLSKAKPFFGIPADDSTQDLQLELMLAAASTAIEEYCRRTFRLTSYTNIKVDGGRGCALLLPQYPVHAVSSLLIDGQAQDDYEIDTEKGVLYRRAGWPAGARGISASFTAGYVLPSEATAENPQTLPATLETACILLAQTLFRSPGVASERVGDIAVQYTTDESEIPAAVKALIRPYKRYT